MYASFPYTKEDDIKKTKYIRKLYVVYVPCFISFFCDYCACSFCSSCFMLPTVVKLSIHAPHEDEDEAGFLFAKMARAASIR